MELIPILSTIILVATISTFLLAIGAYILYKVRERKGQAAVIPQATEVKAELVTPAAAQSSRQAEQPKAAPQPVYIERQPVIIQQQEAQRPMQPRFTPKPQPYTTYGQPATARFQQQQPQRQQVRQQHVPSTQYTPLTAEEKSSVDSKFMKYTTEGYVPAKEDKEAGALRWR